MIESESEKVNKAEEDYLVYFKKEKIKNLGNDIKSETSNFLDKLKGGNWRK